LGRREQKRRKKARGEENYKKLQRSIGKKYF
jgi:hypothetical protein